MCLRSASFEEEFIFAEKWNNSDLKSNMRNLLKGKSICQLGAVETLDIRIGNDRFVFVIFDRQNNIKYQSI